MGKPVSQSSDRPTAAASVKGILENRARLLARRPETAADAGARLELVTFRVDTEFIGIPAALVREIQPLRGHQWSRVPCTPPFITGVANLRGHLCSIMNLARFWGLPSKPLSDHAHLILVQGGRDSTGAVMELALLADRVPETRMLSVASLAPLPDLGAAHLQEYIRGVTPDLLQVLELDRLLSDPRIIINDEV